MKVIASGRQTGRTTQLIQMCWEAEKNGEVSYLVCHSTVECMRVFREAQELNHPIAMPISYDEFLDGQYAARNIRNLYIDDVEKLLARLAWPSVKIAAVTILSEPPVG